MSKVKVLVVDDSAFMRKLITNFLSESPQIEVVGTAKNGKEALEKAALLKPDVVTLDVEMPVMNGLEALKQLMKNHPLPVVMLSSTTTEGAENTITAMQYGAIDFVAKPSGVISLDLYKVKEELINKVLLASRANVRAISLDNTGEIRKHQRIRTFHDRKNQRKKNRLHRNVDRRATRVAASVDEIAGKYRRTDYGCSTYAKRVYKIIGAKA